MLTASSQATKDYLLKKRRAVAKPEELLTTHERTTSPYFTSPLVVDEGEENDAAVVNARPKRKSSKRNDAEEEEARQLAIALERSMQDQPLLGGDLAPLETEAGPPPMSFDDLELPLVASQHESTTAKKVAPRKKRTNGSFSSSGVPTTTNGKAKSPMLAKHRARQMTLPEGEAIAMDILVDSSRQRAERHYLYNNGKRVALVPFNLLPHSLQSIFGDDFIAYTELQLAQTPQKPDEEVPKSPLKKKQKSPSPPPSSSLNDSIASVLTRRKSASPPPSHTASINMRTCPICHLAILSVVAESHISYCTSLHEQRVSERMHNERANEQIHQERSNEERSNEQRNAEMIFPRSPSLPSPPPQADMTPGGKTFLLYMFLLSRH